MKSLKDIWYSDEYKQLREQYSDRLCFICFGGSYAYGTNIESSDIDIRGVMLPTIDELIGLKKFYQKEDSQSDTVFYEFNKFVKLCMENNPNILEMLHCRDYIIFNDIGKKLLDITDLNSLQAGMEQYNKESALRDRCDFNAINDFVIDCNSKIINNTVIKYKEPLYQINL